MFVQHDSSNLRLIRFLEVKGLYRQSFLLVSAEPNFHTHDSMYCETEPQITKQLIEAERARLGIKYEDSAKDDQIEP